MGWKYRIIGKNWWKTPLFLTIITIAFFSSATKINESVLKNKKLHYFSEHPSSYSLKISIQIIPEQSKETFIKTSNNFRGRSWIYPFQQFDSFWSISLIVKKNLVKITLYIFQ